MLDSLHRLALRNEFFLPFSADYLDLTEFASKILHPLVRALDKYTEQIESHAMNCLCAIVFQLGKKFLIFIPMVNRVVLKHKIQHDRYETLVKKIYKVGDRLIINIFGLLPPH